ncbi:MAG: N-6 DNA methylase, partial [Candidatus Lokiarchaeota archaeon]|nr:N-6 DNA methylase [Candidatus Lokiarchaeota archaeon]
MKKIIKLHNNDFSFLAALIKHFEDGEISGPKYSSKNGVVYTPQKVADYITEKSLVSYLEPILGKEKEEFDYFSLNDIVNLALKNSKLRKKILNKLERVKILDPACGSGRFLISAAKILLKTRKQLKNNSKIKNLKIEILENNLFGFEIDALT